MRQLKKYGLCMLLAAILLLTAACGRNNTNNGTTADDNMAGTTEDSNQTNENVDINDILFDTDGDGVYDHTDVDGDGLLEEIGMDANDLSDRLSFVTNRSEQCTKIVNAAEEDSSDQDPQSYRQPAEHSCADRSGNRACACDR